MDQLTTQGAAARRHLRRWARSGVFKRATKVFLSVLLALSQLLGTFAIAPTMAYAETANLVPHGSVTINSDGSLEGTCTRTGHPAGDPVGQNITMPDGQELYGWCMDPDYGAPETGNYHFKATPNGDGSYAVVVESMWTHADGSAAYGAIGEYGEYGYDPNPPLQRIGTVWRPTIKPNKGYIDLQKVSGNTSITDGNGCYSLAGATYEIYGDEGLTDVRGTLTTDSNGYAKSDSLEAGTYWVKEKTAPKGYVLDSKAYEVKVVSDETVRVNGSTVTDQPGNDPSNALVQKIDAEGTVISAAAAKDAQGASTLAGAEFTVRYYDGEYDTVGALPSSAEKTWVYTTNDNGFVNFVRDTPTGDDRYTDVNGNVVFPLGTYTVQETKAPAGYRLSDGTVHLAKVTYDPSTPYGGKWDAVDGWGGINFDEDVEGRAIVDQAKRGGISVQKLDAELAELGVTGAQGDATLAGIQFEIVNENDGPVYVDEEVYEPGEAITPLTLTTDADGKATTGKQALPVGTYTVQESATNESYLNTAEPLTVTITEGDDMKIVYAGEEENQVVRGGVAIGKIDKQNGHHIAQGNATLAGAEFAITLESDQPVKVDGTLYQKGDIVKTIVTDTDGIATTGSRDLPYGTYTVREVTPSRGYLLNDEWELTFSIRQDDVILDYSSEEHSCPEEIIRGDLEFVKVEEGTMARLAGVPFVITSQTTGEWHVIVTDVNGQASTHAEWAAHTNLTNYNDSVVEMSNGEWTMVEGSVPNDQAGTWFDGSVELVASIEDAVGALPYDTYTIQEARCASNEGLALLSATATIYRPSTTINMGTLDDQPAPAIGTTLTAEDGRHVANVSESVHLYDEVRYENLTELRGTTYTVSGELHLVAEDGTDGGTIATATTEFVPAGPSGSVSLEFVFDASALMGQKVVAFETLSIGETVVATHADLEDEGQTVEFPSIKTTLADTEGWHETDATGTVTLVDTVEYSGLEPRRVYQVIGTLMDKGTGEPVIGVDGNPITAVANVSSETGQGTVDVTFTFAGIATRGKTVVAFETLMYDGIEYAVHADLEDEAQTVWFPEIGTTAYNGADGSKEIIAAENQVITDEVEYTNLEAGASYNLDGKLVDKTTEEILAEASIELVPEAADGKAFMDFTFDATELAGHDVVVFETLTREGHVVATHADLDDEGQTVHVPKIGTTLTDAATNDSLALADTEITLVDTIAYENLTPGNTYVATGTLMDKGTGEPLLSDGKEIVAETEFTPEEPDGTVDVTFTFKGIDLGGKTIVAFEDLTREGFEVAVHADLDDEGQTVHIPQIGTTAKGEGGFDEAAATESCKITDTVAYKNLVPGKEYLVIGTLHRVELETRAADGSKTYRTDLGELVDVGGFPVTARTTFVPDTPDGTIDVTFDFDARELAGEQVVVFEEVRLNGVTIADHADIDDDGQTVRFPEIHTTAVDSETGLHETQANKKVTIVDTVVYKGLTPGNTYVAEGTLMNAQSGKAITDKDGNAIKASATFKPEKADGETRVTFTFDASALAGTTIVAFETLSREGVTVAVHADLKDEAQTVRVPQLHTNAYNGSDGSKSLNAAKNAKITDVVTYQGLTVGDEYVLTGTLMDKSTGQPVQQGGKAVTSTIKLTPKTMNGQISMNFLIDATNLAGHDLVVYEVLTRKVNGKELVVAKHEDLNSMDQTVKVAPKPVTPAASKTGTTRKTEPLAQTGQGIAAFVVVLAGVGIASFGGYRYLSGKAMKPDDTADDHVEESGEAA